MKAKAIIFLLIMGVLSILSLTSATVINNQLNIDESINTLEDMKEWIIDDVNNEYVEVERGVLYIKNIDNVLDRLYAEKNHGK